MKPHWWNHLYKHLHIKIRGTVSHVAKSITLRKQPITELKTLLLMSHVTIVIEL